MPINKCLQYAAVMLTLACAPVAQAANDNVVGQMLVVRGSVVMTAPAKTPLAMKPNDNVVREAVLTTGQDSAAQVRFLDETLLTIGRDSLVKIKEFVPPKDESPVAFAVKLAQGHFRFVTGLIAKKDPKAVQFATPFGTIGVRGSAATIVVGGERTIVAVTKCCIDVTAQGKTVQLDVPGFYSEIRPNQPPSTPVRLTDELAATLADGLGVPSGPEPTKTPPENGNGRLPEEKRPSAPRASPDQQGVGRPSELRDNVTQNALQLRSTVGLNAGGQTTTAAATTQPTGPHALFVAPRRMDLSSDIRDLATIREMLDVAGQPQREVLGAHHPASPPPTNAQQVIRPYLTWGYWQAGANNSGQPIPDANGYMPFVSGVLASMGALPQTGTATYRGTFGLLSTDAASDKSSNVVDGDFDMQLDFGSRTITSFTGSGTQQNGGTISILSTAPAPFASDDNPTFQIPLQANANGTGGATPMGNGIAQGGLFGPTGQTAAGVIQFPDWGANDTFVHGTFIGERTNQ